MRNGRISSAALHCHCQIEQDYSAQNARVKISTRPNVHAKVHTFKFSWLFYGSWLQVMKIAKIWTSQNFTDMWYKKVCKCDQVPFPSFRLGPGDEGNKYLLWSVFPLPIGASSGSLFGVHNFDHTHSLVSFQWLGLFSQQSSPGLKTAYSAKNGALAKEEG